MNLAQLQEALAFELSFQNPVQVGKSSTEADLTQSLTPIEHLRIYQNNTLASRINALCDIYKHCGAILGEPYFRQLVKPLLKARPSQVTDLNFEGQALIEYLREEIQHRKELAEFYYLPDLAQLEWTIHLCYYARNHKPFDFEQFQSLNPQQQEATHFELADYCYIFCSEYPLHEIMAVNEAAQAVTPKITRVASPPIKTVNVSNNNNHYLVTQHEDQPHLVHIPLQQYELLLAIQGNKPLIELADLSQELNLDLGEQLSNWTNEKVIVDFAYTQTDSLIEQE